MQAAILNELGRAPTCETVLAPQPGRNQELAKVRAAAIKNIERMLVEGTHYASKKLRLPSRLGMDAVVELNDGRRVYTGVTPPEGAMAEYVLVQPTTAVPVPDIVEDAPAAALPNAGVSAWLALEFKGKLQPGQSVLVLGATGVTGALAVQLAHRKFSAGHITAAGRDQHRLHELVKLGADQIIDISEGTRQLGSVIAQTHSARPFDLVLDFLWGDPAEQTLRALGGDDLTAAYHRTRFLQIGETAGTDITLPAAVLRSAGLEILGQGGGSMPPDAFGRVTTEIIPTLFDMLGRQDLTIDTATWPLEQVTNVWNEPLPSGTRAVLKP